MATFDIKARFGELKRNSKTSAPATILAACREFTHDALEHLTSQYATRPITWTGKGHKRFQVFTEKNATQPFSRASNLDLFLNDPDHCDDAWTTTISGLDSGRNNGNCIATCDPEIIDRAIYTSVISFATLIDLEFPGDRGSAGTFFEIVVGAAISHLTRIAQKGHVVLKVPATPTQVLVTSDMNGSSPSEDDEEEVEEDDVVEPFEETVAVKTDRWFQGDDMDLIVALKISSRERISQISVQQLILDRIAPGRFRSIMCACNENNVMAPKGSRKHERPVDVCELKETLVPGTIALYHRYIAEYAGLYYLDPPIPYLDNTYSGLPPVKRLGTLFTEDLPTFLTPRANK